MKDHDLQELDRARAWRALGKLQEHPRIHFWLSQADRGACSLEDMPTLDWPDAARPRRSRFKWAGAIAACVLAIGAGIGLYAHLAPATYITRVGEQRDVLLPDGSRVTLNTNTALLVRYSDSRRYIELKRGEALFAVQRDPTRPFEVAAGDTLTRAIGTEFNVDLRKSHVTVSVLEGAVRVAATQRSGRDSPAGGDAAAPAAAALSKGQALEYIPQVRRLVEEAADLKRIDAWRTRKLDFTDTPLAEAVEEVNRYSPRPIVIGSHDLEAVRLSGVFRIGDVDGFLYSLREALGVQTHEDHGEIVLIRPSTR